MKVRIAPMACSDPSVHTVTSRTVSEELATTIGAGGW